jgi:hypothetical protein
MVSLLVGLFLNEESSKLKPQLLFENERCMVLKDI